MSLWASVSWIARSISSSADSSSSLRLLWLVGFWTSTRSQVRRGRHTADFFSSTISRNARSSSSNRTFPALTKSPSTTSTFLTTNSTERKPALEPTSTFQTCEPSVVAVEPITCSNVVSETGAVRTGIGWPRYRSPRLVRSRGALGTQIEPTCADAEQREESE